jgi:hypothetical protein
VAYRVRIHRRVSNRIRGWNLPDEIQEEVYLPLSRVLPADLEHNLSRETNPYDGLVCCFCHRDLHVRGREHEFIFHVFSARTNNSYFSSDFGCYDVGGRLHSMLVPGSDIAGQVR